MLEKFLKSSKSADSNKNDLAQKISSYYEKKLESKQDEIKQLKQELKKKDREYSKLSKVLGSKDKVITIQTKKLSSNEEELTGYLNKIFEQQERERIVKWTINCIRETLDINNVLKTTVEEVGKLLKADRCVIALFDEKTKKFILKNEYRAKNDVNSILESASEIKILPEWENVLIRKKEAIIINDISYVSDAIKQTQPEDVKSFAISPVVNKGEILGVILVHQINNMHDWKEHHIDIIKYIGSQIAVAIRQASLYSDIKKQKDKELLLRNIISTIRSSLDISEVKRRIAREIGEAFGADICFIRMYNPKSDNFVLEDIENDLF